ncbi:MAG: CRISPR-associated endonuclease Cas2 [Halanaerobiaceae bacterium]|nr:CRISPR-associated endonuclease Cas2 [Halanaerobiaceae bacterium]
MYIILVYDVGEKRVAKALKTCRKYLTWVQNSVFEGEITDAKYKKLKYDFEKIMNKEEDSVLIYILRTTKYYKRECIGKEKNPMDIFI